MERLDIMKIDFHTHGKLAKKLPFSAEYTNWLFQEASQAGLDAICLTEHFNTWGFDEIYQYIANHFEKEQDCFHCGKLRIFPGMETDIAEGGHVLSVGPMDAILELNHQLEPYKEKGKFLSLEYLLELFAEYPVFVGAAHAYREGGHIPEQPMSLLRKFDFLDLNGKDTAMKGNLAKQEIESLASRLQIPYVAGSDTHQAFQYGCIWNDMNNTVSSVQDLKKEILMNRYRVETSEHIAFQVKTATTLKKALKQIHTLGGDYVSILTGQEANHESRIA